MRKKTAKVSLLNGGFPEVLAHPSVSQTREILKHGDAVTVIKPESLRESIKSEAQKMVKIYQGV